MCILVSGYLKIELLDARNLIKVPKTSSVTLLGVAPGGAE